MRKFLNWAGIILGVLIALLVVGGVIGHFVGLNRLNNAPEVATRPVAVPSDAAALTRGEYLVTVVSGCSGCHGANLEGMVMLDHEFGIYLPAPNLTSGKGGIGGTLTDAQWEQAIRHGIGYDNRVLIIMPANFYQRYSDEDLGAVIAYVRSVPPVDNDLGPRAVGFPGTLLGGALLFDEFTRINGVDHASVGGEAPTAEANAKYGEYLVNIAQCGECHAANLAGITEGGGPPPGPNLTPGGELAQWSEEDFVTALRTGVTPAGDTLDNTMMPWEQFAKMSNTELKAVWAYLQSVPALPNNP